MASRYSRSISASTETTDVAESMPKPGSSVLSTPTNERSTHESAAVGALCLPWRLYQRFRNARILTVEPALFLFSFAQAIYSPVHQQYYYLRYGLQLLENTSFPFPNGSFCLNSTEVDEYAGNGTHNQVETFSVHLVLFAQLANRLPAILITILIGPLSDKFGRKPIIVAVGLGKTIQAAITVVIVHFQLNPYYFILANFFSGVTGDLPGILAGSFAYIADISSLKWRSLRFGIMEASMASGSLLAQFLGGYWLNSINCYFMPLMWMNLACNGGIAAYGLVYLPESLSREERKIVAEKNPQGFKTILNGVKMFFCLLPKYSRLVWKLWASTLAICMVLLNTLGWNYVNVFYLKGPPFDFNPRSIGIYEGLYSSSMIVATTLLMGIAAALKTPDAAITLVGLAFNAVGNLLTGLSRRGYQVFIIAAFQGVDSVSWTGLRGYRSKIVAPEDQGAMFAMAASFEAVTSIIASVIWPNIFDLTQKHNRPGITYIIMAAVSFAALPIALLLLIFRQKDGAQERKGCCSRYGQRGRADSASISSKNSDSNTTVTEDLAVDTETKPLLINM